MKGGLGANHHCSDAPRNLGFTILEVLIVLAVTGVLFVSAAYLVAGKQNQTAFSQAIREVQSQIQQVINEVAVGFYPNPGNFQCTAGASGPNIIAGAAEQGANSGCIFVGKAMQFQVASTSPERFATHVIAGLRQGGTGNTESTSLAETKPKVVAPSTAQPAIPSATSTASLQNGLTTAWMRYSVGGPAQNIGTVAFTSSLAPPSSAGVVSGAQQVNLVPISTSALNQTQLQSVDAINANLATSPMNPSGGVTICFASGGTNQSGLITIGSNNRQLSVKLDIKTGLSCA